MLIQIEPTSEVAIYQQITNQIIEGIATGYLHPGDSLPSVRTLATDLGVNMHTVNKSYHQLENKGIIKIVPKSGAVITSLENHPNSAFEHLKAVYKPLIAESLVVGFTQTEIQQMVTSILDDYSNKRRKT